MHLGCFINEPVMIVHAHNRLPWISGSAASALTRRAAYDVSSRTSPRLHRAWVERLSSTRMTRLHPVTITFIAPPSSSSSARLIPFPPSSSPTTLGDTTTALPRVLWILALLCMLLALLAPRVPKLAPTFSRFTPRFYSLFSNMPAACERQPFAEAADTRPEASHGATRLGIHTADDFVRRRQVHEPNGQTARRDCRSA